MPTTNTKPPASENNRPLDLGGNHRRFKLPPALHYADFRSFFFGLLAAVGGFQIFQFGQFWLVHELTGSPLFLGYVGLANAIPAISLNLVGGVVADRINKRKLIVVTQIMSALLVLLLATLTATHVVLPWHVIAVAVAAGAINAFNQPARQALYPLLIKPSALMSAVALNSAVWQGTRIVAPGIAGVLIALAGTATAFYAAAAGMFAFAAIVSALNVRETTRLEHSNPLTDMFEGLRFIRSNHIFGFLIAMTFFNSFFGMAYVVLMPVFAVDLLGIGSGGQGVLLSVGGIGSLSITLFLTTRSGIRRSGLTLLGGAILTGLSVAAFSLSAKYIGSYPLAVVIMLFLGAFTSIYMITIMSTLQILVPDHMRGRVMGFYGMTWNIMPLGGMHAGALASLIGVPLAVATGGMLVSLFAISAGLFNRSIRTLGNLHMAR